MTYLKKQRPTVSGGHLGPDPPKRLSIAKALGERYHKSSSGGGGGNRTSYGR